MNNTPEKWQFLMQYKFKQKTKKNLDMQVYKVNIYQILFVQFVFNQVELCRKKL